MSLRERRLSLVFAAISTDNFGRNVTHRCAASWAGAGAATATSWSTMRNRIIRNRLLNGQGIHATIWKCFCTDCGATPHNSRLGLHLRGWGLRQSGAQFHQPQISRIGPGALDYRLQPLRRET